MKSAPRRGASLRIRIRFPLVALASAFATLLLLSAPGAAHPGTDDATPPPGYALADAITVPVNGSSVASHILLEAGVTYQIRATGSFVIGGPGFADAEWAFNSAHGALQDNCLGGNPVDLGIGINDTVNDTSKSPDWGPFDSEHIYNIAFNGTGAPIGLNYHDCSYSDNSGSLTVRIFAPEGAVLVPADQDTGVCDGSGTHAATASGCQDDPVNSLTGTFITSSTDLRLPGIGVPFGWTRTYTSGDTTAGRLGPGWTDAYNTSLVIEQNGDVGLRGDEGQQIEYTRQQDGSFVGEKGARSKLESVTGGYRLTRSDQVVYLFDAQGRLTSMKDRNDQGLTFAYNVGELQTITDSVGRQIAVQVNAGLVSRVTLPDGRHVEYGYTGGRLTSVRDAGGGTTTYTYDAGGRLDTIVDQNQHTVVDNTYGSDGRVIQQVNARGHSGTFSWDPATTTSTYTDARLNQWKDVYVGGLLAERIDPLGNSTRFEYDADLNVSRVIDARNNATTLTYDNRGNLLTRTRPAPVSPQEVWTYNARNDALTYQDPRGNVTEFGYDAAGNLTSATGPDADGPGPLGRPQTLYGRDPAGTGLLVSVTDPRGKQTSFTYTNGNLTEARTPLGNRTTMSYDGSGRLTSLVEPRGNATGGVPTDFRWTYTYDPLDRLETQTDPLANVTTLDFDSVGNLLSRTAANQHVTTYGYDPSNNLTSVTAPDPDGAGPAAAPVTRYGYDTVSNLTSREDANQRTTTYGYDSANRLTSMTSPGNRTWTYGYDPSGNLTQLVDANGNATPATGDGQTVYAYDVLDRLTSTDYSDATPDVTFLYDLNGNRTTMTDGSGTETYAYDPLNRLASVTRGSSTIAYAYDLTNLTRRTYPGSTAVDYLYDDDGRMQRATNGSAQTTYAYDPAGNLVSTTLPPGNGYVESRTYDRAGRLTAVHNQSGGVVASRFVATLDPVGNPLQIVRTGNLAETQVYTYDAMDRLTGVCFQGSCPGASDPYIRWTYDAMGNRLTETRPTGTTSYTYNEADELTNVGTTAYGYDQNGNQLSAGPRTFSFDLANRLRTTTLGTTTTTYQYDGLGKRLEATGEGTAATPTLRAPCSTAIGSSNSATIAKPAGTVAGDLLIVGLAFEKGTGSTITPPSGWTLIRRTNQSGDVGYATYRKAAGASEPASYSFGLTNGPKWSIGSCAIANADATTPVDVHAGAFGSSGNPSAPSVTTSGPRRLVLAFYANKKAATFSSYTSPAVERWDAPNSPGGLPSNAMASYELPTSGASGAKTAVPSEQEKWVAQQVAITPTPGAGITRFLWDPSFGVPQLALERDSNNTVLRSYTYGARRISQTAGSNTSYFLYDGLGSVANLTSAVSATQWTYAYEPFGTTRTEISNNGPTNVMKFTGEYLDPTGLYHLRARQYDATTGRFLGRDPVAAPLLEGYASTYPYSLNRPTLLVDPTGLRWCGRACGALDAVEDTLVGTAELIEERKVDLLLGVATVGCAAVAGPAAPGCLVLATVTFGATITSSAVESGVIGDKPANWCQFALSAGASTVLFGTGQAFSTLWREPYVLSAIDQRILGGSTEVITGGLDVLSGAGAGAACK